MNEASAAPLTSMQKILNAVERFGNKVPHPVVIFVILIGIVIVLSQLLYWIGTSVSYQVVNLETHKVDHATATDC